MTDQSRVEAVARAMDRYLWSEIDKPDADRHYIAPYYDATELHSARSGSLHKAQAAIEANDAWLKKRVDIAASRIKDRWMHVQPRETLSWHQVAETTVEALLWEPDR